MVVRRTGDFPGPWLGCTRGHLSCPAPSPFPGSRRPLWPSCRRTRRRCHGPTEPRPGSLPAPVQHPGSSGGTALPALPPRLGRAAPPAPRGSPQREGSPVMPPAPPMLPCPAPHSSPPFPPARPSSLLPVRPACPPVCPSGTLHAGGHPAWSRPLGRAALGLRLHTPTLPCGNSRPGPAPRLASLPPHAPHGAASSGPRGRVSVGSQDVALHSRGRPVLPLHAPSTAPPHADPLAARGQGERHGGERPRRPPFPRGQRHAVRLPRGQRGPGPHGPPCPGWKRPIPLVRLSHRLCPPTTPTCDFTGLALRPSILPRKRKRTQGGGATSQVLREHPGPP